MRRVIVAGASGSIGRRTLEVCARHRDRLLVVGLAVRGRWREQIEVLREWQPAAFAVEAADDAAGLRAAVARAAPRCRVLEGPDAAERLAREVECDVVVNGIVGSAGLGVTLATLERGVRLALANKESLVIGGPLVREALTRGGELLPVDSEHSAAHQCLHGAGPDTVQRLVLTASGGALREHPDWRRATPSEVLAHPVWEMGPRITVDSALLLNKGLELIEAHWLFDLPWSRLSVWLHPQALVHALVQFRDGSLVAHAARPDMRLPIQLALSWPERWESPVEPPGPVDLGRMHFEEVIRGRYPALDLAREAGEAGGTAPAVLNAADEVAVQAFLDGRIRLGQVPELLRAVLDDHAVEPLRSREQLGEADRAARRDAERRVAQEALR
jgi:1-deoxy-D-xylulose-5-phosphate reductoisomerase